MIDTHTHTHHRSSSHTSGSCSPGHLQKDAAGSSPRRHRAGGGRHGTPAHGRGSGNCRDTLTPRAGVRRRRWRDGTRGLVFKNWDTRLRLRGCPQSRVIRGRARGRGQRASVQETRHAAWLTRRRRRGRQHRGLSLQERV